MNSYHGEYRNKLMSPLDAVGLIQSGNSVVVAVNFSEPPALLDAIAAKARAGELENIKTYSFNPRNTQPTPNSPPMSQTAYRRMPGLSAPLFAR
jgi:acyl-CoA hydrolase